MSFASWTFVKDAGNATAAWESIDPIEGTHSYSVNDSTNSTTVFGIGLAAGTSSPCGRVRCMNKQTGTSGISSWGTFANIQTALNVTNSAYIAAYFPSSNKLVISKQSITLATGDTTGLANNTYSGPAQALGDVYALQLNWQQVAATGNIVLIGSMYGPITDADSWDDPDSANWDLLTPVASYTDSSSPYSTGITSGMWGQNNGATVGTTRRYYDLAAIYTD